MSTSIFLKAGPLRKLLLFPKVRNIQLKFPENKISYNSEIEIIASGLDKHDKVVLSVPVRACPTPCKPPTKKDDSSSSKQETGRPPEDEK